MVDIHVSGVPVGTLTGCAGIEMRPQRFPIGRTGCDLATRQEQALNPVRVEGILVLAPLKEDVASREAPCRQGTHKQVVRRAGIQFRSQFSESSVGPDVPRGRRLGPVASKMVVSSSDGSINTPMKQFCISCQF